MLVAYGGRSYLHSLQIFLSVETEETERSGLPNACNTRGRTLLSITGWSANHSARAPTESRPVLRQDRVFNCLIETLFTNYTFSNAFLADNVHNFTYCEHHSVS